MHPEQMFDLLTLDEEGKAPVVTPSPHHHNQWRLSERYKARLLDVNKNNPRNYFLQLDGVKAILIKFRSITPKKK